MVSMPHMMYPTKHTANYTFPPTNWYQQYPTHHGISNSQFLNSAPPSIGGSSGIADLDAPCPPFYNHQHHMIHSSSPDWAHDSYSLGNPNPHFFPNGVTPPTIHLSSPINNPHNANSANTSTENLQNGLQNVPPSPPITVNSACSEMSSPGVGSNNNSGVISSDDTSPNISGNLSRPKSPYEWMKKSSFPSQPVTGIDHLSTSQLDSYESSLELNGKTRTKDKYRVVYTDYQRLELEKEYHMSHYITIRRKSELAQSLSLSERQVKIWFQNRRAKDRKQTKKRDGPINNNVILSNNLQQLSLSHHNMSSVSSNLTSSSMYGLDIKPKMEPGLLSHHGHHHNYGHLHQSHASHPMHHLSTMGMNLLHQSHMHHSASTLPPPVSSPSQTHLSA